MRTLAGLMRPEHGRVLVGNEIWCDTARGMWLPPQRRHVGLVFQHYALMPHLDALGNVALSLLHLPRTERWLRARHWLDHVGLSAEQQSRRPAALSGGQQQRVAMARALAREPRLLLLDEPFSAVDQMSRQSLYRLLEDLRRELSIPIVLVTHDLNEARLLADRMAVMDGGQILQVGTPASIHQAPRSARVADLVGIQNRFQGLWLGPSAVPGLGQLRWLAQAHASEGSIVLTVAMPGVDRDSAVVAKLFDERDPAVKAMLEMAIKACLKAGKYVGICGQGPSDHPDLAQWLLDQGIESISLNPDTVVETWLFLAGKSAD
jgi:molybdate transport system ATP-binding protein